MAVSAITAASASAAEWYVGGSALSGSAKLSKTVKVEESIVLTAKTEKITGESVPLKITCTSATLEGGTIVAPGTAKVSGVELGGCTVAGVSGCSIEKEVDFNGFEGPMSTGTAPEDSVEFKEHKVMADILFLGSKCFFTGESYIYGKFAMKVVKGQEERAEQEFVGEGEASKGLELGWGVQKPPVYVTGRFKLKLESGANWSFH